MTSRSRGAKNRFEIDNVLDDLLASDGEDQGKKKATKVEPKATQLSTATKTKPPKLTAGIPFFLAVGWVYAYKRG